MDDLIFFMKHLPLFTLIFVFFIFWTLISLFENNFKEKNSDCCIQLNQLKERLESLEKRVADLEKANEDTVQGDRNE